MPPVRLIFERPLPFPRSVSSTACSARIPRGSVQFYEATHLTAPDWDQLQHTVRHRVLRYFPRHGLLERHVTDDMLTWRPPVGSASMPRSTSRPTTELGWNDSCATVPVLPSPSNGSRLPATVRPEPSASSIVLPIPHRVAAPLSRSPPSSSSSDLPCSFTRHASTGTALGVPADPGNLDQYEITAGIALINAVATSVTGNVIENAKIGIGSVEGSDLQGGTDNTLTFVFTGLFLGGRVSGTLARQCSTSTISRARLRSRGWAARRPISGATTGAVAAP